MISSTVRAFNDPDAFHKAIRDAQAEGVITRRGNFQAELASIRFDRISIHRSTERLSRLTYSVVNSNLLGVIFATHADQEIYINGLELAHGDIIVFRAGSEGYNRSSAACQWGSIMLTHQDAAAAGEALIGREVVAPLVTQRIKPSPRLLSRLLSLHEAAAHLAKTAPDILGKPEVGRAIDQALAEAMVACLANGHPVNEGRAYRHHARVMQRLEDTLRANPEGPLYMADLCKAAGVSHRTLIECCQEHLGMSPKRYLLLRRMHLAWRALRREDAASTTVTEIATNYGFWELGRFSVVYHSMFGESPSTTLRRSPEDPGLGEASEVGLKFAEFA